MSAGRGAAGRYAQQNAGQTDRWLSQQLAGTRDILAATGIGWGGVGQGPGVRRVPLDTGRQAGRLPGQAAQQGLAPGLEVGLAQKWVGKLISSPLLILELEPNG